MIVKNTQSSPKKQQQIKPYFLQGLQYARDLLVQIKKYKQVQLQYSPINNTVSSLYIQKGYKNRTQSLVEQHKHPSLTTQNNQFNSMVVYEQSIENHDGHDGYNEDDGNYGQVQVGNKNGNGKNIHSEIAQYQQNINQIGKDLQQIYQQIEAYQVVFENLVDCYQANQNIYNKNQRLKRQGLKLDQQKREVLIDIQKIQKQRIMVIDMEKVVGEFIKKQVEEYVKDVIIYNGIQNDDEYLCINPIIDIQERVQVGQFEQDGENEGFSLNLNLNYRKLKQKFDIKNRKKVLPEPKKLSKGISFEQEVDLMEKYYEDQISAI